MLFAGNRRYVAADVKVQTGGELIPSLWGCYNECVRNKLRRKPMQLVVNLVYDSDYRGYVADVPELPGCMSQGKTVDAALRNVREAIDLYLETVPRGRRRRRTKPTLTTVVEV